MRESVVRYPEGLAQSLKMSEQEFAQEIRFLAAVKLFELGRLSAGKAAELAGLDRLAFLASLQRVGAAAINIRDEEIDA